MLGLVQLSGQMSRLVSVSNDSFEGEPEEKRRKTTNVVIDQPATELKVVIDNVACGSSLEEVRAQRPHRPDAEAAAAPLDL